MPTTPERPIIKCDHNEKISIRKPEGYEICSYCGFGFFNDLILIRPKPGSSVLPTEIPKLMPFTEELKSEINQIDINYLQIRSKVIKEHLLRCNNMEINDESRFLT